MALPLPNAGCSQEEFTTPWFQKKKPKPCYFGDNLAQGDIAKWPQVAAGSGHSPGAATLLGGGGKCMGCW